MILQEGNLWARGVNDHSLANVRTFSLKKAYQGAYQKANARADQEAYETPDQEADLETYQEAYQNTNEPAD